MAGGQRVLIFLEPDPVTVQTGLMKTTAELSLKIPAALRTHFHYTGISTEMAQSGRGASRAELNGAARHSREEKEQEARQDHN
jgi:hypothetical protein